MRNQPELIIIGSMHGHGNSLVLRILDGHPNILHYPFFFKEPFLNFAIFFGKGDKTLKDAIDQYFVINPNDYRLAKDWKNSTGKTLIDLDKFKSTVYCEENKSKLKIIVNAYQLIQHLLESFRLCFEPYKNMDVKYYSIFLKAENFPWEDKNLMEDTNFIVPYRDIERGYISMRSHNLESKGNSIFRFIWSKAPYHHRILKLSLEGFKKWGNADNFYYIKLNELQRDTENTMKKLSEYLSIEFHPSLTKTTLMGIPISGGHFTKQSSVTYVPKLENMKMGDGKIQNRGSKYFIPFSDAERRILGYVITTQLPELSTKKPPKTGIVEIMWLIIKASFVTYKGGFLTAKQKYSFSENNVKKIMRYIDEGSAESINVLKGKVFSSRRDLLPELKRMGLSADIIGLIMIFTNNNYSFYVLLHRLTTPIALFRLYLSTRFGN